VSGRTGTIFAEKRFPEIEGRIRQTQEGIKRAPRRRVEQKRKSSEKTGKGGGVEGGGGGVSERDSEGGGAGLVGVWGY